ncbi:uncharacterized protein BDR25DRAFT_275074 [Lindgomyces ingoldianus]|uniref:Uncharacterized protein n=1 Tax=Lindgomyces ingoldianus TaxID=673940 RepID=A0ACB6RF31_9PLEO|nr:uncharacterized protein BDR25DRAFT_275074 [Lindgomyces ingoldianus]KAF2477722.1 hypothetical protein BDR25DRAFT_275074 [Lindgomyces ingoldianus]
MVGVPKSTGCFICRKRKIKCDETWPSCINCQKNGKCCPGPPARHTFKDLGPRLKDSTASPVGEVFYRGTYHSVHSPNSLTTNEVQRSKRLTQLNEKWSDNGGVFQKFRISNKGADQLQKRSPRWSPHLSPGSSPPRTAISRQPSPSRHQELSRALVEAFTTGSVGHRMSAFGPFIREVPARIGHNVALDAAVACLVNAHSSMVHKKKATEIANPGLYLRAVQALQTCLESPKEGMSSNTLCASVLLGLVEAMAGPRVGNRYLAHVGGAGRLMELQGPEQCQDRFAKEILRFNRGGIIITSIYERKPCFLTRPEWSDIAFDNNGLSFEDHLYTEILRHMANFPALLRELRDLDQLPVQPLGDVVLPEFDLPFNFDDNLSDTCPSLDFPSASFDTTDFEFPNEPYIPNNYCAYSTSRAILLNKLQNMKQALCSLGEPLNARLRDGSAAVELPSIEDGSPIPTAFHFNGGRVAVAYNCFWSLLILTNKVIMKLLPLYDSRYYALEAECRTVAFEICKTWEDAWASKPIGAFHTGLSFVMAYEFTTLDVQAWILRGLNALLDHQLVDTFRWSDEAIAMMSGKLCGEGPDLVFTHGRTTG